jgi:hypothetical protein
MTEQVERKGLCIGGVNDGPYLRLVGPRPVQPARACRAAVKFLLPSLISLIWPAVARRW